VLLGAGDRAQAKKALDAQENVLGIQRELLEAQRSAADAQARIAKLESERGEREFFGQFSPKARFRFEYPQGNSLTLEDSEPFIVESIDYLTGSGANVGSEDIGKSSSSIQIPISDKYLGQVVQLGPWLNSYDRSANRTVPDSPHEGRNEKSSYHPRRY
jgi:hypothetical protein